jgi:hypothetical protein
MPVRRVPRTERGLRSRAHPTDVCSVKVAAVAASALLALVLAHEGHAAAECSPLGSPSEPVVQVSPAQADELPAIAARVEPGTTIVLADGVYRVSSTIVLAAEGVSVRSRSGRPGKVVIDGGYKTGDLIAVAASRVTIAEVTLTRSSYHLVHAVPPDGARSISDLRLYRLVLRDASQQFVKVNPNAARSAAADRGRVECSDFRLTARGRPHVSDVLPCYTGGIDAHGARGWVVRLNRFEGIYCNEGLAEHAIHFWTGSRGTLVERNVVVNCARGIGFGLGDDPARGHSGGLIRNNVVVALRPVMDTGIGLENARGARVYHNTVFAAAAALTRHFSSIDLRFPNTDAGVSNNVVTRITVRDGATPALARNLEQTPASYFRNPSRFDFHLTASAKTAIDRGSAVPQSGVDIDGEARSGRPDLGADEVTR